MSLAPTVKKRSAYEYRAQKSKERAFHLASYFVRHVRLCGSGVVLMLAKCRPSGRMNTETYLSAAHCPFSDRSRAGNSDKIPRLPAAPAPLPHVLTRGTKQTARATLFLCFLALGTRMRTIF